MKSKSVISIMQLVSSNRRLSFLISFLLLINFIPSSAKIFSLQTPNKINNFFFYYYFR